MFHTIKSKIIALTVSILLVLLFLMLGVSLLNYKNNKDLIVDASKYNIESFTEQINREMSQLEDNAKSLALLGEYYFQSGKWDSLLESKIIKDFENYQNALGGGVWFKPYVLALDKRLKSVYAFRNDQDKIVLDSSFESEDYDYPMQRWYLEILAQLTPDSRVVWSTPYFEGNGAGSLMTTVGVGIYDQDKLIGVATVDWEMDSILKTISKMHPTKNSFVLFADKTNDYIISTTDQEVLNKKPLGLSLSLIPWYHENLAFQSEMQYKGKTYVPFVKTLKNGMILIVNIPKDELFYSTFFYMTILSLLLLVACVLIAGGVYFILQKNINTPIEKLTQMANKIGQGNLNLEIHLNKPKELSELAQTLNKMTKNLKTNLLHLNQISKEKEKMKAELSVAQQIQKDALPQTFPLDASFELYASMDPAKDVGGDFYDFFFVDKEHLAFVMADVSGKGITAALFMMSAKAMIRNIIKSGHPLYKVAQKVNKGLCDASSHGMFVTAFIGVLDLKTGYVEYINAGHCPPLIKKKGQYQYLSVQANLVLGVFPDFDFKLGHFTLSPEDRLFLYTDGVTEAQNRKKKFYGSEFLRTALNQMEGAPRKTLALMHKEIKSFANGAEQSDDITMMEIVYHGFNEQAKIFEADLTSWPQVLSFLKDSFPKSEKKQIDLELVVEEIYTNIVKYAYRDKGTVRICLQNKKEGILVQFFDWGIAYNPLQQKAPDVHAGVADRKIGGLGLYMVKQMTQKMTYQRLNGQNILTVQMKKGA